MKTLLSILFYVFMAGTTATVGTNLEDKTPEEKTTPVETVTNNNRKPALIKTNIKHGFKAFGVRQSGNNLVITWAAQSARISQFLLEYSIDGKIFQPLVQVNYTGTAAYKYVGDNSARQGYYRVGSIKKEGSVEYSSIKKMRTGR